MEKGNMTFDEMAMQVQSGKIEPIRLWMKMNPFIRSIAQSFTQYAELEDLIQESYFGFLSALKLYKVELGFFSTYSRYWIRQAMARYIDNNGQVMRVPVNATASVRKYDRAVNAFQRDVGRMPTTEEMCEALGLSEGQLAQIQADKIRLAIGSLDSPVGEDAESTVGDMVADPEDLEGNILEKVQQEQLSATLWPLVDELKPQQAEVIRQRYKDGKTREAVGDALGVTGTRVEAIEKTALKTLSKGHFKRALAPFLDDIRYSKGLDSGIGHFKKTGSSSTERAAFAAMAIQDRLLR